MVKYSPRASRRWQHGMTVDMHRDRMRLTLAIVAKVLFGTDVEAEADEIGAALATSLEYLNDLMSPWIVHRNARYDDRPQAFAPGRWTVEFRAKLPRFAYFPFGGVRRG